MMPPLPYPFNIATRREFILAYYETQRAECAIEQCPTCDAEAQNAVTVWENILPEHRGQRA